MDIEARLPYLPRLQILATSSGEFSDRSDLIVDTLTTPGIIGLSCDGDKCKC